MQLVLHPGHSKCGSTTIQDFLYTNREVFLNRGVWIPDLEFNFPNDPEYKCNLTHTSRDYFAKIHNKEIPMEGLIEKLEKMKMLGAQFGCSRVIISAENLINYLRQPVGQQIHELFKQYFDNVKVVYYIRRQDQFLLSSWQQWGHKDGLTFKEYIERSLAHGNPNYDVAIKLFKKIYGANNLKVFPISTKYLKNQNLILDFCHRAGINSNGLNINIQNKNRGLSPILCESLANVSDVYSSIHDGSIKEDLEKFLNFSQSLYLKDESILSDEIKKKIYQHFCDDNEKIRREFFDHLDYKDIFGEIDSNSNDLSPLKEVSDKVNRLEKLCAIQTELIIKLIKSK